MKIWRTISWVIFPQTWHNGVPLRGPKLNTYPVVKFSSLAHPTWIAISTLKHGVRLIKSNWLVQNDQTWLTFKLHLNIKKICLVFKSRKRIWKPDMYNYKLLWIHYSDVFYLEPLCTTVLASVVVFFEVSVSVPCSPGREGARNYPLSFYK